MARVLVLTTCRFIDWAQNYLSQSLRNQVMTLRGRVALVQVQVLGNDGDVASDEHRIGVDEIGLLVTGDPGDGSSVG